MTAEQAITRAPGNCNRALLAVAAADTRRAPSRLRHRPGLLGSWSNAGMRGSDVRVVIDDATARVLTQAFLPR